jgi:hypothetical protein
VAYAFLERPGDPVVTRYTADDEPGLAAALTDRMAGIEAGAFAVARTPDAELCAGCPGRGTLCSWPLAATWAEPGDGPDAVAAGT